MEDAFNIPGREELVSESPDVSVSSKEPATARETAIKTEEHENWWDLPSPRIPTPSTTPTSENSDVPIPSRHAEALQESTKAPTTGHLVAGAEDWPESALPGTSTQPQRYIVAKEPDAKEVARAENLTTEFKSIFRQIPQNVSILTTTSFTFPSAGFKATPSIPNHLLDNFDAAYEETWGTLEINTLPAEELGPSKQAPKGNFGITLSSLTSLSLNPPMVTFNIRQPSHTLEALKRTRHFLLHVMAATKPGEEVARAFSNRWERSPFSPMGRAEMNLDHLKLQGVSVKGIAMNGEEGERDIFLPRLLRRKAVAACIHCKVLEESELGVEKGGLFEVGDHVVVVARVMRVLPGEEQAFREGLGYRLGNFMRAVYLETESEESVVRKFLSSATLKSGPVLRRVYAEHGSSTD